LLGTSGAIRFSSSCYCIGINLGLSFRQFTGGFFLSLLPRVALCLLSAFLFQAPFFRSCTLAAQALILSGLTTGIVLRPRAGGLVSCLRVL
jgi:hypothetical protein